MNSLKHRTGIATTAAAVVVAVLPTLVVIWALFPNWIESSGIAGFSALQSNEKCRQELEMQQEELRRHVAVSDRISALLAHGQLSLKEAVEEVAVFAATRESFDEILVIFYPGAKTSRGRLARYLLMKAYNRLSDDPVQLAEAHARLEGEYRLLESPGGN